MKRAVGEASLVKAAINGDAQSQGRVGFQAAALVFGGIEGLGSKGGPKGHSVYPDGVKVFEGNIPKRLGEALPDPKAVSSAHFRLRWDNVNGRVYQAREFNSSGKPVRDIDFTTPTKPNGQIRAGHTIAPEQHLWQESKTGGSMQRQKQGTPFIY